MSHASLRIGPIAAAEPITETEAAERIAAAAFQPAGTGRIGVEVEWLITDRRDPLRRFDPAAIRDLLESQGALPKHTALSFEPGGAIELSSPPADSLAACFAAVEADRRRVQTGLDRIGADLTGIGLDPVRAPRRLLRSSRCAAMEQLFDQDGRAGRWMMANTASVQVCVDSGEGAGRIGRRWALANRLAPLLIAAFANSPFKRGEASLWRSTRQHVWSAVDASRSAPVPLETDPVPVWVDYALSARVMAIPGERRWTVPDRLTFLEWLRDRDPRSPTAEDLEFHLTTLFPPVRPRGRYLELRMVDAQPGRDWIVPAAVASALIEDERASEAAWAAMEPLWATARSSAAVDAYAERFVARGRTPADDLLGAPPPSVQCPY